MTEPVDTSKIERLIRMAVTVSDTEPRHITGSEQGMRTTFRVAINGSRGYREEQVVHAVLSTIDATLRAQTKNPWLDLAIYYPQSPMGLGGIVRRWIADRQIAVRSIGVHGHPIAAYDTEGDKDRVQGVAIGLCGQGISPDLAVGFGPMEHKPMAETLALAGYLSVPGAWAEQVPSKPDGWDDWMEFQKDEWLEEHGEHVVDEYGDVVVNDEWLPWEQSPEIGRTTEPVNALLFGTPSTANVAFTDQHRMDWLDAFEDWLHARAENTQPGEIVDLAEMKAGMKTMAANAPDNPLNHTGTGMPTGFDMAKLPGESFADHLNRVARMQYERTHQTPRTLGAMQSLVSDGRKDLLGPVQHHTVTPPQTTGQIPGTVAGEAYIPVADLNPPALKDKPRGIRDRLNVALGRAVLSPEMQLCQCGHQRLNHRAPSDLGPCTVISDHRDTYDQVCGCSQYRRAAQD